MRILKTCHGTRLARFSSPILFSILMLAAVTVLTLRTANAEKPSAEKPSAEKPNIVLFFIDDLGYMEPGCYGSTFYETPQIDLLASRGVRFTNFYSAHPVCSPTRAALMTGKAPQRVGITQWISQPSDIHLPTEEFTIAEALAENGYHTGYIGKWHLGEADNQQPTEQGFGWTKGVNRAGAPGSYFYPFKRNKKKEGVNYWAVPDLEESSEGDYLTDKLTDQSLEFIEQNKDKPFFLCFGHYAVHTPIQAPDALTEKYKSKLKSLPPSDIPEFFDERNGSRTRGRQDNPTYAAMLENLDTNVGRVVDRLESLGLSDNTIIVFTSDNGGLSTLQKNRVGPTSCKPLRGGKGWNYEGGIKIPTIVVWPKQFKKSDCDTPAITMDLYPTLLDMVGLPLRPEQHLDGQSLVSAINGQADEKLKSRFLAWTYPHDHGSGHSPANAIRAGDWKLIHITDDKTKDVDRLELYNLANDPYESTNLKSVHPEKAQELAAELKSWVESTTHVGATK